MATDRQLYTKPPFTLHLAEGYQLLSMMFRSSFSRAAAYSSDSVPCPAECKNAGHLCVAGVDTRTHGTYLGVVSFGRPLINNG
jgi:hypothetical protein